MASGYIAAVLEYLPRADLVLDHFLLVKWFNEKLSLLRRQLYHQATDMHKAVLKGSRWLLLKAWIQEASCSGIRILKDAARKLLIWKPFILNWHKHRISPSANRKTISV